MRHIRIVLLLIICVLCAIMANAEEPAYRFVLSIDGANEKQVQTGDILTVYCQLEQDAADDVSNILYAFQNEIEYDSSFITILEDSYMMGEPSVIVQNIQRNARINELYVNYLSMTGGTEWAKQAKVCIFQIQIVGKSGVGRLRERDTSVSLPDGSGSYAVSTEDLFLVINEDCTVDFDSCGGSAVSSQTIKRYTNANRPADPVRAGYRFIGWFNDIECTEPWRYDEPISCNMYVYAGWKAEDTTLPLSFTDVQQNDWFYEGILYAAQNGLMNGVSATKFEPNGETSRAMLVTILWRMNGCPTVEHDMKFTDVASEQWYTEAIRWAASTGVVQGYSETEFGLNDPVTREQMAVMLYRYAQKYGNETVQMAANTTALDKYQDAEQISTWATEGLGWAVYHELLRGVGNDLLSPGGYATRAQTATILMRFCE